MNRALKLALVNVAAVAAMLMLQACSTLLYFPSRDYYTDPQEFRHKPEQIAFESEDGVKLKGWYFKSVKRPPKATLLFFHGNAQNISTHFFSLYWLLEEGYDYMIFDYRGYGASEGTPSPEGTVKDGRAALRWLNANKAKGSKTVIFAQSIGSAIGLRVACDAADAIRAPAPGAPGALAGHAATPGASDAGLDYDAVIVDSGFVSYTRAANHIMSHSILLWPFQWLAYFVISDEFAPKDCVAKISPRPILVVAGDADRTVDLPLGQEVYDLSRDPKEFWRIEGGRHIDFVYRENFRYRKPLVEWLEKALSGGASNDRGSH